MFRELKFFPNGMKPEYTFFTDFDIACHFGEKAVKDTWKQVKKSWKDDYKAMTEVNIVLNLLCWDYYNHGMQDISKVCADLYYESKEWFYNHYEDNKEALDWFFKMTD